MGNKDTPPGPGRSHLEQKLLRLGKVYERYGRDALKDYSLTDVQLLLSSKELDLQAAFGRQPGDPQSVRLLTLEVADLAGYVRSQFAALRPANGMTHAQMRQHQPRQGQQHTRPHDRGRDFER